MDELVLHPYPESQADDLLKSYPWPSAGFGNLDRVKQALWDAFNGTGQPTVETGLKIRIGEIGWQTKALAVRRAGVHRQRERRRRRGGSPGEGVRRDRAARARAIRRISSAFFFGLVDEPQLDRWQAGLLRANYSAKPSYHVVREAITTTKGRCSGTPISWQHTTSVVGAVAKFGRLDRGRSRRARRLWAFTVTAEEEATYRAGIVRLAGQRASAARGGARAPERRRRDGHGHGAARWSPRVSFPARTLPAGRYAYAIELAATMNPGRKSLVVSAPFRVGVAAAK